MSSSPGEDFERFVRRASPRLLRTAYLLVGDRGRAEDILQLALVRTAEHWSAALELPEAYARRVVVNLATDEWRRLARRVRESPLHLARRASVEETPIDALLERQFLLQVLRALPERQRQVVVLRFWEGLSVAETASLLKITEGTVKSHGNRGLTHLRELLSDAQEVRHGQHTSS